MFRKGCRRADHSFPQRTRTAGYDGHLGHLGHLDTGGRGLSEGFAAFPKLFLSKEFQLKHNALKERVALSPHDAALLPVILYDLHTHGKTLYRYI